MSQTQSNSTEIQYALTINTEQSTSQIRKLETSIMRILGYIEQLTGGDPNIQKAIRFLQSLITTIRAAQAAITALEMASGPVGWLFAATSIAGAGFAGYSMLESMGA